MWWLMVWLLVLVCVMVIGCGFSGYGMWVGEEGLLSLEKVVELENLLCVKFLLEDVKD